jgi:transposase-like protein
LPEGGGPSGVPGAIAAHPRLARDEFVKRYEHELPTATKCFLDDFESCLAHLRLPSSHRRAIRTTNMLERLFGEERRRTKVIPHAFGERPAEAHVRGADPREPDLAARCNQ